MTDQILPAGIEALRVRTSDFIRDTVIPAEPRPGEQLDQATRDRLRADARAAGVFAPHVPQEFGGQGVSVEYWHAIFSAAGHSPIGWSALGCLAPDEGTMDMLKRIATSAKQDGFSEPAGIL
jgi:acyl-CoA dehydrogenase